MRRAIITSFFYQFFQTVFDKTHYSKVLNTITYIVEISLREIVCKHKNRKVTSEIGLTQCVLLSTYLEKGVL